MCGILERWNNNQVRPSLGKLRDFYCEIYSYIGMYICMSYSQILQK